MRTSRILLALAAAALLACGDANEARDPGPTAPDRAQTASNAADAGAEVATQAETRHDVRLAADGSEPERKKAARAAGERPLPAFGGQTLAGSHLSISSLIGKRMLLFFFNPEVPEAEPIAQAVAEVAKQSGPNNFNVVGIGVGSNASVLRSFAQEVKLEFPIINDSNARITTLLRLQSRILVLGVDSEGYVTFVHPGFDTAGDDAVEHIAGRLRESLRIAAPPHAASGALIQHPVAPSFETTSLSGQPFDLASLRGRPVVLMFFLHTCPHCHHALEFMREQLPKLPEAARPQLVAISLQNRPTAVRSALEQAGLDFFEPLVDPDQKIAQLYGVRGGVPDISLIDAEGRIIHRSTGWRDDRDPALTRMYLARIAGEKPPMLLSKKGYAGNDVCAVCHEQATATWELTSHARAYDTLVTHGQERDPECISCHVVGFDRLGGWSFTRPEAGLENVGCENCHGRGGPHLSPDFLAEQGYAGVCGTCHDAKHSLGFEFGTFLPGISHAALASLSDAERAARFSGPAKPRQLLPTSADYVGSEACQSCHVAEFTTWATSGHARALTSLVKEEKTADADCLACHTTGFGLDGGFPVGGNTTKETDLARVGCESCHGPGGDHVPENATRLGSILSLGDKCDSCVILQICGSCHDEANDPGFEFKVQEHIDRQRHGTIEAGSGKPLGTATRISDEPSDRERIAEALEELGREG
ncbi:MAG: redoxin domain-containing protein [Deltaproteobacteria bacterium]|nr:redoxin domain-containing protein [Deltaproteobacteria bacterium]MBW2382145.1 redoxin domain-containing protein [Deltaproteobacteria bacterium]MBW2695284.1 redoxin domain-containing protein [Deltaproteobacteria bacterium]